MAEDKEGHRHDGAGRSDRPRAVVVDRQSKSRIQAAPSADGAAPVVYRVREASPASCAMVAGLRGPRRSRSGVTAGAEFWYEFAAPIPIQPRFGSTRFAEARGVTSRTRSCWADLSPPRLAGPVRTSTPPGSLACGATSSGPARPSASRSERPAPFPQPGLLAARVALTLEGEARAAILGVRSTRRVRRASCRSADRRRSRPCCAACRSRIPRRRSSTPKRRRQGGPQGRVRAGGGDRHRRRAVDDRR